MSGSHIFRAQSIGAGDAQALDHTVRHNRQRLAVAGAEQKNESDEFLTRCGSLLVLSNSPWSSAPLDHVGIEADRRDLELRDHPVHGLEDVASIVVKRSVDIAARPADRSAFAQLAVSLVQLRQTLRHRQQLRNLIIVQDDRHFYASVPFLAQFERRSRNLCLVFRHQLGRIPSLDRLQLRGIEEAHQYVVDSTRWVLAPKMAIFYAICGRYDVS